MITNCPYCQVNSAGQHEFGCVVTQVSGLRANLETHLDTPAVFPASVTFDLDIVVKLTERAKDAERARNIAVRALMMIAERKLEGLTMYGDVHTQAEQLARDAIRDIARMKGETDE